MRAAYAIAASVILAGAAARAGENPPAASVDSVRGVRVERKPRTALAITGAAIFGGGWVLSFLVALSESFAGISPAVLVPLAGPWIGLGYDASGASSCPLGAQSPDCNAFSPDVAMAIAGGLELVGATLFGIGMVPHEVKRPVRVAPSVSFAGGPRFGLRIIF